MEFSQLLNLILHIDKSLGSLLVDYGPLVYGLLFGIVFAETGLVIFPFLPGDTLLFMAGAFCATGAMHTGLLIFLLVLAAVTGNTVNYYVGRAIGQKAYSHNYRWLDRNALEKTHAFFEAHGGKTVMMARWLPLVRTFAPFVAGIGRMQYTRFVSFSVIGSIVWVGVLVALGWYFGNLPWVKKNLSLVILVIIAVSTAPLMLAFLRRHLPSRARTDRVE